MAAKLWFCAIFLKTTEIILSCPSLFVAFNRKYAEFCMENYVKTTKNNPSAKPIRSLKLAAKVDERLCNSEKGINEIMRKNPGKNRSHFSDTPSP